MECPICLEPFGPERPAMGPSVSPAEYHNGCTRCFCEACGDAVCRTQTTVPIRCVICRRDQTQWFADAFCWMPPEHITADEIRDFALNVRRFLRGALGTPSLDELLATGERILRHL